MRLSFGGVTIDMTIEPAQIEAHAAQGYSLLDVARLLGLRHRDLGVEPKLIDAFNEGARRWRGNGSPVPPKVGEIIAQKVMVELKRREMTRAQLKEIIGVDHGEINLALESLETALMIDHEEDGSGTSHYRASGVESTVAAQRKASTVTEVNDADRGRDRYYADLATQPAPEQDVDNVEQEVMPEERKCHCGRTAGHTGRHIGGPAKLLHAETGKAAPDVVRGKGCTLPTDHTGMCSKTGLSASGNGTNPKSEIAQPVRMEMVTVDKNQDTSIAAKQTTSAEVYGGVRVQQDIDIQVAEIAQWPEDRVIAFVDALAESISMEAMTALIDRIEGHKPIRKFKRVLQCECSLRWVSLRETLRLTPESFSF